VGEPDRAHRGRDSRGGPHRNYPRHLFGVSPGTAGFASALLVAKVLLRWLEDAAEHDDEAFGFLR